MNKTFSLSIISIYQAMEFLPRFSPSLAFPLPFIQYSGELWAHSLRENNGQGEEQKKIFLCVSGSDIPKI